MKEVYFEIMYKVVKIDEIVQSNKDFTSIMATLRSTTQDLYYYEDLL